MLARVIEDESGDESRNVEIMQNTSSGELGATVWDAGLVMIHAFAHTPQLWQPVFAGKSVLDLSCGTGAVGIALVKGGQKPSSLVLTDRAVLVDLIRDNVSRNKVGASVVAFDWGGDVRDLGEPVPFDVVLLSDVVTQAYAADFEKLLRSLRDITHDRSVVLLSVELRSKDDEQFFEVKHKAAQIEEWKTQKSLIELTGRCCLHSASRVSASLMR